MEGKECNRPLSVPVPPGGGEGNGDDDNPIASFDPYTLRTAAAVGDVSACEWFISKGKYYLELYLDDEEDDAEEYAHRDVLDYRSDVNAVDRINHRTALHYACEFGHIDIVALLLALPHVDLEARDKYGACAVHVATPETLRVLLTHEPRANSEAKDENGRTCLLRAAASGNIAVIRTLFDVFEEKYIGSAYLDRKDSFGMHALALAGQNGHEEVCRVLVGYGASVDAPCGPDGMTALMYAVVAGKGVATSNLDTVRTLLDCGADPSLHRTRFAGYTTLHLAAIHNCDAIPVLGSWDGINLHSRTLSGLDAVALAVATGNRAAVEALIGIGCHVSMKLEDGAPVPSFAGVERILGFPAPLILSHALRKDKKIQESLGFLANVSMNGTALRECLKPLAEETVEELRLEDIDWELEFAIFFKEKADMPERADLFYLKKMLLKHEGAELECFKKVHEDFQVELPENFSRLDKKLRGVDIITRPLTKRQRRRKREVSFPNSRVGTAHSATHR
jgi:ankyrin repeat protein